MKEKGIQKTGYMTEIDQFLREFDAHRVRPQSCLDEIEKFKEIFAKRDGVVEETSHIIWKEF